MLHQINFIFVPALPFDLENNVLAPTQTTRHFDGCKMNLVCADY